MARLGYRTLKFAAGLAATLGAFAAPVAAQSTASTPSGWQPNDDDFLLLELRIKKYRLTQDVRGYRTNRGVCLDLADVIQALDLPIRLDKKSRRATGWLFSEDQRFVLDREANLVQNKNNGAAPLASDIHDTPEGWCVEIDALSRWFGIDFKPDLFNSVIRLESERDLPFMQAIERRSRAARLQKKPAAFDLSKFPSAQMEYKAWRTPSADVVAQFGYESGPGRKNGLRAKSEVYVAGEALGASYFARVATDDALKPQSLRVRAYRQDPSGNLLGPLEATEVAAGDVQSRAGQLTAQTAVGRGAFVTNLPLGQSGRFSTTSLRGNLPAGWDAELYRNGQLIAFQADRGDGRYEFLDVDLFFGRNELEVVLYGPQGQIKRERYDYPVGARNIEPGKTYYWAGFVQANRDLIELDRANFSGPQKWRWGVGIERGLDERTSAAIAAQSVWHDGKRRHYTEASLTRSFGAMLFELGGAQEWGAGQSAQANVVGRLGSVNLGANALWTFGRFASEFVDREIDHRFGLQFDSSLRFGKFVLPLQLSASRSGLRSGGSRRDYRAQTSAAIGRVVMTAQLTHLKQTGNSLSRDFERTSLSFLANSRIKDVRLRANAIFELSGPDKGLEIARVSATRDLDERSDLNGEIEYLARARDTRFRLGYTRRFKRFALRGDASVSTRGEFGARISLNFSIGPDPVTGGLRISEKRLARFGQADVLVFRDDNGDGRRNADEPLLRDVGVEAGFRTTDAVTGENGRAMLDDLRPFRPVLVGVDESTLGDPFLAPAVKGVVVVPRPGVAAKVALPIAPSGEVEGLLLGVNGVELAGVELELVDRSGRVVASTISEFDGFFLFQRVPYGRYRLRVAAQMAKRLEVARDLKGEFSLDRNRDIVRLGTVRLRRGTAQIVEAKGAGQTGANSALGP